MSVIVIIILVIILILVILDIVFVDWMTRYACDSRCPDPPANIAQGLLGKKAKKINTNSPSRVRAEELKKLADETVVITNREGMKLSGHWYRCEQPKRIILAGHGWRSSWNYDFNGPYKFLHHCGCSVLFIEQRCHGSSEGRYYYHGKKERFDYVDWVEYIVKEYPDNLPIYVYGLSMGGASAIMSTTAGIHERVKGVIADSAYTSAQDTGLQTISNIGVPPEFFYSQVRIDYKLRLKMADNAYTTIDALRENTKIPILFISGTKDKIATVKMQKELFSICKTPKLQLIVEGAGHMKSYYQEPQEYEKIVREFFEMIEENPGE